MKVLRRHPRCSDPEVAGAPEVAAHSNRTRLRGSVRQESTDHPRHPCDSSTGPGLHETVRPLYECYDLKEMVVFRRLPNLESRKHGRIESVIVEEVEEVRNNMSFSSAALDSSFLI